MYPPIHELHCPKCQNTLFSLNSHSQNFSYHCGHSKIQHTIHHPNISTSSPFSVCLTVSYKKSFRFYSKRALLHVGISDSKGIVYNFDEKGLHSEIWKESLSVSILPWNQIRMSKPVSTTEKIESSSSSSLLQGPCVDSSKDDDENEIHSLDETFLQWDSLLLAFFASEKKRLFSHRYHPRHNNCYDFVLRFLNSLDFLPQFTKISFAQQFLSNQVSITESYLKLFLRLQEKENSFICFTSIPKALESTVSNQKNTTS